MGKIDVLDKRFFEDRARFAELINTEIYHGERILVPEELEPLKRSYPSLAVASGEKTRDVLMLDRKQNFCYGLEIETESDYSMPERVMVYDAGEYEYQIREIYKIHKEKREYKDYRSRKSRMQENDFLIPTLTMVLYLGQGKWKGKRKLRELFQLPQELRKQLGRMLQSYTFPLIEAEYVNPENYQTDLREFFQAMQCRGDKRRLKELCQTERFQNLCHETEIVISAHLGKKKLFQQVEEGMSMCKALDDWMKEEREIGRQEGAKQGVKQGISRGIQQGVKQGVKQGIRQEKSRILQKMLQAGLEETLIMQILNCTKEELAAAK